MMHIHRCCLHLYRFCVVRAAMPMRTFLQAILDRESTWHSDRRPPRDELAQAHVGFAYCIVMKVLTGGPTTSDQGNHRQP